MQVAPSSKPGQAAERRSVPRSSIQAGAHRRVAEHPRPLGDGGPRTASQPGSMNHSAQKVPKLMHIGAGTGMRQRDDAAALRPGPRRGTELALRAAPGRSASTASTFQFSGPARARVIGGEQLDLVVVEAGRCNPT